MSLKKIIRNLKYLSKYNLEEVIVKMDVINAMLDNVNYEVIDNINKQAIKLPKIKDRFETLDAICKSNLSVCRYGDGECMLMHEESIPFQKYEPKLAERLREIISSKDENTMVCLADFLGSLDVYTDVNKIYWRKYLHEAREKIYKYIDFDKQYYDACVTRPYINYLDKSRTKEFYDKFKKIWQNKDIVIVEGEQSRLGINNDLFTETKSIKRILAPVEDAFSVYDELLAECLKQPKDKLFLVSLGPTATVLAFDLTQHGYRAIDTGHLDIEYEWFLAGAQKRTKIKGKYVLEAGGASKGEFKDDVYEQQIVKVIKK